MISDKPKATTDGRPPALGLENASAPQPIGPDGQHGAYWVLPEEERAKGFIRPVRTSYVHVGSQRTTGVLRDLTPEEQERYAGLDYAKFEEYGPEESPLTGRSWTQTSLDAGEHNTSGCGSVTRMGRALAETWARDVSYYGATYCCRCNSHLPVAEFVWEGTTERLGS